MSKMLSVASGFQYSVNIGYDLNNDEKLKNFIPTKASLELLSDILASTSKSSSDRARILIGAYGKGKSHIMLTILSMLTRKDIDVFEKCLPKIKEDPALWQLVQNYYDSNNKILPIVITGSNTNLTQAFILGLQRTLSENNLLDVMPATNYEAAVGTIERWKKDFPDTYDKLAELIDDSVEEFIGRINSFDIFAYEQFEKIYPELTSGSVFNPFLGFDVVELYESVAKGLTEKGYTGIYLVYDEFSKYLESNITDASVSDTKMLQDFAEKCCRSGNLQMHIMLISHKEISNYIDKLPKQKLDGWRGVSERFKHVHMNENFAQTYELISTVIQKKKTAWNKFCHQHDTNFNNIRVRYSNHMLFLDAQDDFDTILYGCYPLHPVSTFVLPRLSERIAQNERTLFTFLSAEGQATLSEYLSNYTDSSFSLILPDLIYDYFEPLLRKEAFASDTHSIYVLTNAILAKLKSGSLDQKIIKTIALIYILGQFERLKPTKEELVGIFSSDYPVEEIEKAISRLIDDEYVIYLKQSNNFLRLKKTSGVDVNSKIADYIEKQGDTMSVKDILNRSNVDNYLYPARYNDAHEMTRYFAFQFIDSSEVDSNVDWNIKSESLYGDGIIYAILAKNESDIKKTLKVLLETSVDADRCVFVILKHFEDISIAAKKYSTVLELMEKAQDDEVLYEEYEVISDDLGEVVHKYINNFSHPERNKVITVYRGNKIKVSRRSEFTELLSQICDEVYGLTPVINNEALNRNEITNVSSNSRGKIIAALLRSETEKNLGLSGNGQEISIMRSTLIRTGILREQDGIMIVDIHPQDQYISHMLSVIERFIISARTNGTVSFDVLYDQLTSPTYHIGLRKGLIPIYLAAVLHEYKQQVVIENDNGSLITNSDALLQINAAPENYRLAFLDWNPDKEAYIERLSEVFSDFVVSAEKGINEYEYVANALKRWFLSLPKYSKEAKTSPSGGKISSRQLSMMKLLRQEISSYELLFVKLPKAFGYEQSVDLDVACDIEAAKSTFDGMLDALRVYLINLTKAVFIKENTTNHDKASLTSVIKDWCDELSPKTFEQLFADGTEKCLSLFKTITNDERAFIMRLSRLATDLRIEDWDNETIKLFEAHIREYKNTAENFSKGTTEIDIPEGDYEITFAEDGEPLTRRFERVPSTPRGKLLRNQIEASLDAMGQSISEQEKRQILMEILRKLC